VVINETMARTFFPDRDPVGERLLMDAPVVGMSHSGDSTSFEIVGVIADEQLWPFSDRTRHAVVYVSNEQDPEGFGGIIVRTSLDPASFETTLRAVVAAVDKRLLVGQVKTVDQLKAESMNPDRVRSTLLGLFAAVALALSAIGIYGVIAYSVVLRTHEIGIRAALGASSVKLATLVAGQGLVLSLLGLLLGSLVALGVARFLQSLLFGVGTVDAITWSGAGVVVLAVAILAGIIPARAAARVDPLEALRAE
jgi:putative ABC transport system permease protein